MTNAQLADLLRKYSAARNLMRDLRGEMVRVCVEHFGMSQSDAVKMDLAAFLDGYLVGHGIIQSWRVPDQEKLTVAKL